MKAAEENFYHNLFNDTKTATTKLWKTLGDIINPSKVKKRRGLSKLFTGNEYIKNKNEISNQMNYYFCTIGGKLAAEIPQGNHPRSYMKNRINETIFLEPIFDNEITMEIKNLNNRKSPGPDNISPKILKACEPFIKTPLTKLFNYSIETATYPSKLKLAKVLALHKKKSIYLPENYRPISLLSCIDKIFEKLLHKRFMKFIEKHKIIILNQYGFLKKHSTVFALIDVVDHIRKALDKGEYALGIYLDLRKAFDTVNHKILLDKLEHYGFRGHTNKFIKSYLTDRKQFTVVNGIESSIKPIETGVPQGSVLGPLFFLIYINDITNCIQDDKVTLFADDTSILYQDKNLIALKQKAEVGMGKVYDWLISNKLSLSWEKTFFMIFHSPFKKVEGIDELKVGNFNIKRVNSIVYLGMHLDDQLKWDRHVSHICNCLSRNFHMFYSIRHLLNDNLKKQLYYSLVYSRILYAVEIYGACRDSLLKKVQTLQNKLLKVLFNLPPRTSTNELHTRLKLLKVKDIHNQQVLKFVYESVNKVTILQFHKYYKSQNTVHDHNTRSPKKLYAAIPRNRYGESTLHVTGTQLWNNLSQEIQKCKSSHIFKRAVKQKLLSSYG